MIVLASASPRRRELLLQAGIEFSVETSDVSEDLLPGEAAADYVSRLAEEKARAVYERVAARGGNTRADPLLVIGADTCVLSEGKILGKPGSRLEARRMLASLSGRTHQVLTGVAVVTHAGALVACEVSQVLFDVIGAEEMQRYLDSGEPMDKAGAYGIQGYAARWIPRIEGCFFNVMGLPIARTVNLLAAAEEQMASVRQDPGATASTTLP